MSDAECCCDPTGSGPHLTGCPLAVVGELAPADVYAISRLHVWSITWDEWNYGVVLAATKEEALAVYYADYVKDETGLSALEFNERCVVQDDGLLKTTPTVVASWGT